MRSGAEEERRIDEREVMRMAGRGRGPILLGVAGLFFLSLSVLSLWCFSSSDHSTRKEALYQTGSSHTAQSGQVRKDAYLGVVILTAPTEWDRRSLIRDTWLSAKDTRTHHFFPIGMKGLKGKILEQIEEEESRFGDILRLPQLEEAYGSLSAKIMESFSTITASWHFQYLLKVDADTFVDFNKFYPALRLSEDNLLYWGFLDGRAHVKTVGKWAEKDWKLSDRYLPYALGGGYVLSGTLVDFIARNKNLLQLYHSEDVSVGAWLAGLKIKYVHDTRFDTEWKSRGCSNRYLVTHKQSEKQIRDKWRNLRKLGRLCEVEVKLRASYEYNWDAVPSKCCIRMDGVVAGRHQEWVSGLNGTSLGEVSLALSTGPLSVLIANLAIPWLFPARNFATGRVWDSFLKLVLDHMVTVIPFLCVVSYLSDRIVSCLLIQMITALSLFLFSICENVYSDREDKPTFRSALKQTAIIRRPMFITYFRAYVLISTGICILAVDFTVFPRRFAKTETYGYGLMDVGVGLFVFLAGLTCPEAKRRPIRFSKRVLKKVPLLALGFGRLVAVKMTGYQEHVTEYGAHWNFFFTLAFAQILSNLLSCIVPIRKCAGLLSVMVIMGYQFVLLEHFQIKSVLLQGADVGRTHLLEANREGIFSVLGYLSIYFFALQLGVFIRQEKSTLREWGKTLVQLFLLSLLFLGLLLVSEDRLEPPSRRLANITYVLWIIHTGLLHLSCFLAVELVVRIGGAMNLPLYSYAGNPFDQLEPSLACRINEKGLWYFLLANLLTGAVNFSVDTLTLSQSVSTLILATYSFALSVIIAVLPLP